MIPAGAAPINSVEVAQILGVSLSKLRNRKLVDQPGFPSPLNPHRARDRVWERTEVEAYALGRQLAPRPEPSADDLLDDIEAAEVVGVSLDTFAQQASRLTAQPRSIEAHGLRYWRRGDLARRHASPPGRGGKPAGAKDLTPRRRRGAPPPIAVAAAEKIESLSAYLAQLTDEGEWRPGTRELAKRFDVSMQTVRRWLALIEAEDAREASDPR